MDRGLWRVLRVYPVRIIQVDLDEREFVRHGVLGVFPYGAEAISQNGADPIFSWIIG